MKNKKILLVQLPVPCLNWEKQAEDDPLAIAYLKAYADQHQDSWEIQLLPENLRLYASDPVLLRYITVYSPEIVGFSLYCWNIQRSNALAVKIRQSCPSIILLAGGPEITPDSISGLDAELWHFACIGEGERTFLHFLDNYSGTLQHISGLGISKDKSFEFHSTKPVKIQDLDTIPNPYLSGTLQVKDDFMMFETLRGCPYDCFFCYYGKDDRSIRAHSIPYIKSVLDFARDNNVKSIYLLDPAFNTHPDLEALCRLLRQYNECFSIHTEIKVERLTPETVSLLKGTGIKSAEIGLQTTGKISRRLLHSPLDPEKFQNNVHLLHKTGIKLFIDLIIGLPGDTEADIKKGARYIKTNLLQEGDEVQVFHLSVLPGTRVRTMAQEWKIQYDSSPPYLVTENLNLHTNKMASLLDWVQDFFGQYFELPEYPYFFSRSFSPPQLFAAHEIGVFNRAIISSDFWTDAEHQQLFFQQDFARHLTLEFINPLPFREEIFTLMEELFRKMPHNVFKVIWNCPDFEYRELEIFLHKWSVFLLRKAVPGHYFQQYYRYFSSIPPPGSVLTYLLLSATRYLSLADREIEEWAPCVLVWDKPARAVLLERETDVSLPLLIEEECLNEENLSPLKKYPQPVFFRSPEIQQQWIKEHTPEHPYPPLWRENVRTFP